SATRGSTVTSAATVTRTPPAPNGSTTAAVPATAGSSPAASTRTPSRSGRMSESRWVPEAPPYALESTAGSRSASTATTGSAAIPAAGYDDGPDASIIGSADRTVTAIAHR